MSMIHSTDPDFRISQISFHTLLEIQLEAEDRGLATRWSSADALRGQVKDDFVLLQSLMREERGGFLKSYRCLVLFSTVGAENGGGIATIDLDPARFESLERLDRDSNVHKALTRVFSLALGGISAVSKN